MIPPPSAVSRSRRAFTLVEMLVAVGILAIGGGIAYPLLSGDLGLWARNLSLNKSNNSLRYSLQMLKKDIDMAIEPPLLMSYRVSGTTGILKPADTTNAAGVVTTAAVSAQALMMWVNLGPAYDLVPTSGDGTGGTIAPAGTITLKRHVYSATDPSSPTDPYSPPSSPNSPEPQVGDRLVFLSPAPYSAAMPEIVPMDGAYLQKPGRRITSVNGSTSNPVSDNGSATITVTIDLTNTTLPPSASNQIYGDRSAYVVREVAYVANTVFDSSGTAASRQLLYYPSTQNMTYARVLSVDFDPNPQEQIPASMVSATGTGTVVVQPFNYYISTANPSGGRSTLSPVTLNLPVRALDYAHAIADRNLAPGQINVSSEFNVFLRSSPQMGVKSRLD